MNKSQLNSLYGMQVNTITKILLKLQFNVSSIGFNYWITAITQYRKNYFKYNNTIEQVYHDVAKIHNTTRTRVERAMRTAKATATEEYKKEIIHIWDAHYTKDVNINTICNMIDNYILKLYRKENKYYD